MNIKSKCCHNGELEHLYLIIYSTYLHSVAGHSMSEQESRCKRQRLGFSEVGLVIEGASVQQSVLHHFQFILECEDYVDYLSLKYTINSVQNVTYDQYTL